MLTWAGMGRSQVRDVGLRKVIDSARAGSVVSGKAELLEHEAPEQRHRGIDGLDDLLAEPARRHVPDCHRWYATCAAAV